MNKSPAFAFFPKDWISDIRVRTMTASQRGYYIDLLSYMWLEKCYIPVDSLKGLLVGATDKDIDKIVLCLDVDGQFYTQKRLLQEFDKQADNREKAKLAADIRWAKENEKHKKKKTPRISMDEQLKTRAKTFRDKLNEFHHKNPKKYELKMYKKFFEWWGIPENTIRPRNLVFENEKSWDLEKRLAYWYGRTINGNNNVTSEEKPKVVKPITMD